MSNEDFAMDIWNVPAPTRPKTRVSRLAAIAATPSALALMAVALVAIALPFAFAQTLRAPVYAQTPPAPPAPKVQPKAAPKAPPQQAAAPAPASTPQMPPITFTPWTKVCVKGQEGAAQQICLTQKEGRFENGVLAVGAQVAEADGQPNKVLRLVLPLGMLLPQGTRAIVDQGQPMTAPYLLCAPYGCLAEYEASEELIGKLKKGQNLLVQGMSSQGMASLQVPLADFAKAYEGPPIDPKVYEERQKKLEEEFDKKRQLMLQQQQQQQGAPK
jgi:invasion protein IalB